MKWSSGHYAGRLVEATRNFEAVYAAWNGDLLVGLICAMDNGPMTAYVHYLLVRLEYHGMGIGKESAQRVKVRYSDYLRIVVVVYDSEIGFYENCGFEKAINVSPMFITDRWA